VLGKARRQIRDTVPRRWPLHRWPLHRWPLHRWPLHRIGFATTVYRLRHYGVSASPLRDPVAYGRRRSDCLRKAATPLPTEGGGAEQGGPCARRTLRRGPVRWGKADLA